MEVINAPIPFFETYEEGLKKDFTLTKNYYKYISSTSNFILEASFRNEFTSLKNKMLENINAARQVLLLYMSLQPEYDCLISVKYEVFLKKLKNYPLVADSSAIKVFGDLNVKVQLFAKLIRKYFASDIFYLFIFSWSTFPSVYGYFTSDYYFKLGNDLIIEFLTSPTTDDVKIVDSLLPPYFLCAFEFLIKFWSKVSFNLSQKVYKSEEFFVLMIGCISSCSYFLSNYHKNIIEMFYRETPNRCITFIFNDFLKLSFDIIKHNDDFLFSPSSIEQINDFLNEGLKTTLSERGKQIINAFTMKSEVKNENEISIGVPSTPDDLCLRQFQFLISPFDIGILSDIYSFGITDVQTTNICKPETLAKLREVEFKKGFSPKMINVPNKTKSNTPLRKVSLSDEYEKFKNDIYSKYEKQSDDPIDYYIQNIHDQIEGEKKYDLFQKSLFLNQIFHYEQNYEKLNLSLRSKKIISENNSLLNSINSFFPSLISMHCEKEGKSRKVLTNEISNVISQEFEIDLKSKKIECFTFVNFCSFLNLCEIEPDEIHSRLSEGFMKIIRDSTNKNAIQNSMLSYRRAKNTIENICNKFKCITQWKGLGRQFNAILNFVNEINSVHSHLFRNSVGIRSKILIFFKYALLVFNSKIIFDVYLILKLIMNKNKDLLPSFDEKNQNKYKLFEDLMDNFFKAYNYYSRCLSYIQNNSS